MARHRLSTSEIQLRIAGIRSKFPSADAGIPWQRFSDLVDGLHATAARVDADCAAIESNHDFSIEGIARKRAELVGRVVKELTNDFKPLAKALAAIANSEQNINERMDVPKPPEGLAAVMLASDIRRHVAAQRSPIDFAMAHLGEPEVLSALLYAPHYLSNLSANELSVIRSKAAHATNPEQVEALEALSRAREEATKAVKATVQMVLERGDAALGEDGQVRPLPRPTPIVGRHSPQAVIPGRTIEPVAGTP